MKTLSMQSAVLADQATPLPTFNVRPFFRYFLNFLPTAKGWFVGSLVLAITLCSIVDARGQCANIDVLNYTTPVTVALGPGGVWTTQCGNTIYPNGQERIFSFTPTASGQHILESIALNGNWAFVYYIKPASAGCSISGWTCLGNVSTGTLSMGTLTAGVEYYLLIDHPTTSGWTWQRSIQIFGPESVPPCLNGPEAPTNNASFCLANSPSTLSWSAAAGVTGYEVYFGTSANPPLVGTTTATSYSIGALAAGTYYWQVRPMNASGAANGCPVWSFTVTNIQPPTGNTFSNPIIIGSLPYSTVGNNLPSNCWTSTYTGTNAQNTPDVFYSFTVNQCSNVSISTCGSPTNFGTFMHVLNSTGNHIASSTDVICGSLGGDMVVELAPGTYYLVVEGYDNYLPAYHTGTFGLDISTTSCVCDNITPLATATPVTVALGPGGVWTTQCGNTIYPNGQERVFSYTPTASGQHILESIALNGNWAFVYYIKPASAGCSISGWTCLGNVSTGTLSMGALTAGVEYYLLIDHPTTNGWTWQRSIQVLAPLPPPACLNAPTAPANNDSQCMPGPINLSWPAATGATSYEVYFGTSATPPLVTTTAATSYAVGSLTAGTYYWQVRPVNANGTATGCPVWSFTVQPSPSGNTFSNPIVIGSLPYTATGNNLAANCWTDNFTGPTNQSSADVFYRFTNTACQSQISIALCGSALNTYLHVLDASGTEIAFNNDNGPLCSGTASSLQLALPPGTYYIVVEGDGAATGSFTLNVTAADITPPTITCPANAIVAANASCSGTVGAFEPASVSDNCTANPTVTQSPAAGTVLSGHNDVETVTLTADDGNGNTQTCSFTVTLKDQTGPSITCPANTTVVADANCSGTVGAYEPVSVSDNCTANPTVTQSPASSTLLNGHNDVETVTFMADDGNGNTQACSFTVTLQDQSNPSITCPTNTIVAADAFCSGSVGAYEPTSGSDNCTENITVTQSPEASTVLSGHNDVETVTLTADDGNGNTQACSFTVTLKDQSNPSITCPANAIVAADANCSGIVGAHEPVSVSDNCTPNPTVTQSPASSTVLSGHNDVETVTLTADDGNGNTQTCSFTVTLIDQSGNACEPVTDSDSDCDGVLDAYDLCPGGDDSVDMNEDGLPDCKYPPTLDEILSTWKCGPNFNKVLVCHNGVQTRCFSYSALVNHLAHGDYIGGCDNSICIENRSSAMLTGIEMPSASIYPNPTSKNAWLELSGYEASTIFVRIQDLRGSLVQEKEIPEGGDQLINLDLSTLQSGVYFVRIQQASFETKTLKLIVNN